MKTWYHASEERTLVMHKTQAVAMLLRTVSSLPNVISAERASDHIGSKQPQQGTPHSF
jgi:hypothetical protein